MTRKRMTKKRRRRLRRKKMNERKGKMDNWMLRYYKIKVKSMMRMKRSKEEEDAKRGNRTQLRNRSRPKDGEESPKRRRK